MNWGKATVLILISFVVFIGGMSYVMFKSPADDFDHAYYEKGLNFDHDYNREELVTKEHVQPVIAIDTCCIRFTFPQVIKGRVQFTRPSSDVRDTSFIIDNTKGNPVEILTRHLAKGKWQLAFEWKSGQKEYLYHQEVSIK